MAMPQGGYGHPGQYGGQYDNQPLMQGGGGYNQGGYPPQGNYPPTGSYQGGPPGSGSYGPGGGHPQQSPYSNAPGGYPGGPGGGYDNYPPGQYPPGNSSLRTMQTTTSMNLVFFAAAGCVMLAALIAATSEAFTGQIVDFLQMCYMFTFGAVLAVLDTPFFKTIKAMGDLKMYIGKYVNLLTRVTGKGLTFVFVGSALFSSMWDNLEGGFMLFVAVVLCAVPTAVGIIAIVIGIMKSQKLSKARKHVAMGALEQRYDQWAQTYRGPMGGLTPAEFNGLTMENGGFKWEDADLKLIFNALVSNPAWRINSSAQYGQGGAPAGEEPKIPKDDLMSWVRGGMVWL